MDLEPRLVDLATGEHYFAVTPAKIRQAVETANTLWLTGAPEERIYEYLAVVDQLFRDRFGAPARHDEPLLRPLIRQLEEALDRSTQPPATPSSASRRPGGDTHSTPAAPPPATSETQAPPPPVGHGDATAAAEALAPLREAVRRRSEIEAQLLEVEREGERLRRFEGAMTELQGALDAANRPYLATMRALYGRNARSAMAEYDALVLQLGPAAAHEAVRSTPARLAPLAAANANGFLGVKEQRQVRDQVTTLERAYTDLQNVQLRYDQQLAEGTKLLRSNTLPGSQEELRRMCSARARAIRDTRGALRERLTSPTSDASLDHLGRLLQQLPDDARGVAIREMPILAAAVRGAASGRDVRDAPTPPPSQAL